MNGTSHAAYERSRFAFGVPSAQGLRPEHFEDAKADLEGLLTLSEQHQDRLVTLDEEFITEPPRVS